MDICGIIKRLSWFCRWRHS